MTPMVRRSPVLVSVALALISGSCAYRVALRVPVTDAESTRILAADGSVIRSVHAEQDREQVHLRDVAKVAQDAVIAIEDERFYEHRGVDLRALVRAASRNASEGKVVEGGSTITQQYVKNVLLDPAQTGRRKLKEAVLAYQLERKYTKRTILERYLNTIYFGNGAYGIQAAAHTYFATTAAALTLPQATLLAGIIRSPEEYDPRAQPQAALARRNVVLDRMDALHLADHTAVTATKAQPIGLVERAPSDRYPAAYFVDEVQRFIEADSRFGPTKDARDRLLFEGGLRIETTLDPKLQAQAEDAVAKVLSKPNADPAAGLVAIDPRTGFVRALVGGRDFFGTDPHAKFDLATQGHRQTGSAFKPFVLAAALQQGIPLSKVYPAPTQITIPLPRPQKPWVVHNVEGEGGAPMTLLDATVHSVNTVYAQVIEDVGPKTAVDLARQMGITAPLLDVPAAVLGANVVSVEDMASAYATFANDGVHNDPVLVTKVERTDGTVLYERASTRRRVLPIGIARQVTGALQEVVNRGTGINARLGRPAAGKTGTADNEQDAWFVGYTPELTTAVWVGFADKERPMTPPATRITVFGGTWPAQIWQLFSSAALAETPASLFPDVPATSSTTTSVPLVTVPSVIGALEADARSILAKAGYAINRIDRPNRDYPPGVVVDETPSPGTVAGAGSTVTIIVSAGPPKTVSVPNVLNEYADDAAGNLRAVGLVANVIVQDEPPPGSPSRSAKSWKQSPAAGAAVDSGSTVTVWVNHG